MALSRAHIEYVPVPLNCILVLLLSIQKDDQSLWFIDLRIRFRYDSVSSTYWICSGLDKLRPDLGYSLLILAPTSTFPSRNNKSVVFQVAGASVFLFVGSKRWSVSVIHRQDPISVRLHWAHTKYVSGPYELYLWSRLLALILGIVCTSALDRTSNFSLDRTVFLIQWIRQFQDSFSLIL